MFFFQHHIHRYFLEHSLFQRLYTYTPSYISASRWSFNHHLLAQRLQSKTFHYIYIVLNPVFQNSKCSSTTWLASIPYTFEISTYPLYMSRYLGNCKCCSRLSKSSSQFRAPWCCITGFRKPFIDQKSDGAPQLSNASPNISFSAYTLRFIQMVIKSQTRPVVYDLKSWYL